MSESLNRETFYCGCANSQQMLSHLLAVGRFDSCTAAGIAGVAKATIDVYRAPSSRRPVPMRVLTALENAVFDRMESDAKAAGYWLKRLI